MLIQLNDFLEKLETVSYLNYRLYGKEEILFITLCTPEELQQYLIREMVPEAEHLPIRKALEKYRQ